MAQYHPLSGETYGKDKNLFQKMEDDQHHGGIVSNPVFANNITFNPIKVQQNNIQEYGEWFTSTEAFRIQDQLPMGASIVPIIAASDKTLEMHPLFVTIGNIDSDIHMKASSHAWQCVAFIPIPKFETHPDYQTILQTRVWHKCVDLVFANLKSAALHGDYMTDPFSDIQHCFTPLVAWTADLPEQLMIASSLKQFGDGKRHASHTGEVTLERIFDVTQNKCSKDTLLTGVHLPFWRNWQHSDPSIFLVPELFFNHILTWCKEIVGKPELDFRFKAVHKCISMRQFSAGVSHVQQMTGCEHRDIQRKIVPVLAGAAPPDFVTAIHSQSPIHTDTSIQSMEASLNEFHIFKSAITEAGARKGKGGIKTDFYIPKLELLQSFADAIRNSGVIIQYTAKAKNFSEQVIRILDRDHKMRLFDLFTLLTKHGQSPINSVVAEEHDEVALSDPALA
ncbi:hypothetical protein BDN67DRAFT_992126 [Paxillus ammoniavirescens]|nr:hypothetical protein BDN67DRAFT_992126 [Paxillus ammoniavirescens]